MKLFGFQRDGVLGFIGRYKITFVFCGLPLISREAFVLDSQGGGGIHKDLL